MSKITLELKSHADRKTNEIKSHGDKNVELIKNHVDHSLKTAVATLSVEVKQAKRALTNAMGDAATQQAEARLIAREREVAEKEIAKQKAELEHEEKEEETAAQRRFVDEIKEDLSKLHQKADAARVQEAEALAQLAAMNAQVEAMRAQKDMLAADHAAALAKIEENASERHNEAIAFAEEEAKARRAAEAEQQVKADAVLVAVESLTENTGVLLEKLATQFDARTGTRAAASAQATTLEAEGLKSVLAALPTNPETKKVLSSITLVLGDANVDAKALSGLGTAIVKKIHSADDKDKLSALLALSFFARALGVVFNGPCATARHDRPSPQPT